MKQINGVVILNMDGVPDVNGDIFTPSTILNIVGSHARVPVYIGTAYVNNTVGLAKISRVGFATVADIELYDDQLPSLSGTYPVVSGLVNSYNNFYHQTLEVKKYTVECIYLGMSNIDSRIKPLSHYLSQPCNAQYSAAENEVEEELGIILDAWMFRPDTSSTKPECACKSLLWGHEDSCAFAGNPPRQ